MRFPSAVAAARAIGGELPNMALTSGSPEAQPEAHLVDLVQPALE
jgi:hypothetical protein